MAPRVPLIFPQDQQFSMVSQNFCSSVGLEYNKNKDEIPYICLFAWRCWEWLVPDPRCTFLASHWLLRSHDSWWATVQLFWWFALATCDLVLFWMAVQALCIVLFDKRKKTFFKCFLLGKMPLFFCFMCRGNCSVVQLDDLGWGGYGVG